MEPKLSRHIKLHPTIIALLLQKATQKIENSQFIEQKIVISFCPSLCLLQLALSFAFLNGRVLSVLTHNTLWNYKKFQTS